MSIRASLISFLLKRTVRKQFDGLGDDVQGFRDQMAKAGGLSVPLPSDVSVVPQTLNGVPCEWVTEDDTDQNKVLLYLHGGGYVFGGPDSHRELAWRMCKATRMRVLMVDYRLAPENPFPAAVEDSTNCYRWLLDEGFDPQSIAIGGDSAGGGLTVATLVNLKNLGLVLPACCILLSPWLDLTVSGDSASFNEKSDVMLTPKSLKTMASHYLGDRDPKAPLASPLFADLSSLPPTLVHVGSTEVLLSDAERYVDKCKKAGGDVSLEIWPKMPHVFQVFAGRIPEGIEAIQKLGEFVKTHTRSI